ncbi:cysteine desulfurase-like protein, SufS subfamily [Bernardetia litoralis DSM 6794]|uniref:Cysteine desulfurase n=1 Tax=Bernardetia litoralis (strain ATCC 23117 / DSM 6794 / NBRC 15988 / NCIMB 1366 / Fx l1 / Sio-4) TaxID=880071 RepID=I4AHS3_BERLS|nr:cysteine desulfurase [Bernardetia litoralis]AFM03508.1 cysteine desulfurase-like protein, SufS subfamily [Bernardetia litoralis DSM 6794]
MLTATKFDINKIREEFPILHQDIQGKPLIYFDNAATTQKPKSVIDALSNYYLKINSNVHRGAHTLAERATEAFEQTRKAAQQFINSPSEEQVIFTRGTTESINLVAQSYGRTFLKEGDEIIISSLEHHSNIVPWQIVAAQTGAKIKVIPIFDNGELDMEAYQNLLSEKTKIVAVVHVSNSLGTINPVKEIIKKAHQVGAKVLIDGAQASSHLEIDVQDLDVDFYAMSGHKVYAPTGIGILYGKKELLEAMPPYMGGGEMIKEVDFDVSTYNVLPYKFEAGTPNIADTVALRLAFEFVNDLTKKEIIAHEQVLLEYGTQQLSSINGLHIIGTAKEKASVISFVVDGVHPYDMGLMLDANGIAIRTGHHCTQPLMKRLNLEGTARASFALYNTKEEIDTFAETLEMVIERLK